MAIYVPAIGAESWKGLLADPEKQWQTGYSAKTLAYCWGAGAGLPPEIGALFGPEAALLIGIPEHKVDLPGGGRPSQTDLFALVRRGEYTISCAIEGKVSEPFGPTIQEWLVDASTGKIQRLNYLCRLLGLVQPLAPTLRYQLLHRSASAIIEAARFKTDEAAMIVHSFSTTAIWFGDFAVFIDLFGLKAIRDRLLTVKLPSGLPMHFGWATGDPDFLTR
jgi:hypothetical protein